MKIRPMEAGLFNKGGQTGRRDETSFADEPKTINFSKVKM